MSVRRALRRRHAPADRSMLGDVRIEMSPAMKPDAWMSFDAKGEVTGVSAPGVGAQLSDKADVTVKMVCGRAVYDEMMAMAQAVANTPERPGVLH